MIIEKIIEVFFRTLIFPILHGVVSIATIGQLKSISVQMRRATVSRNCMYVELKQRRVLSPQFYKN